MHPTCSKQVTTMQWKIHFYRINSHSNCVEEGASEAKLLKLFKSAQQHPFSIVILDELDLLAVRLAGKKSDLDIRVAATLKDILDNVNTHDSQHSVYVIGICRTWSARCQSTNNVRQRSDQPPACNRSLLFAFWPIRYHFRIDYKDAVGAAASPWYTRTTQVWCALYDLGCLLTWKSCFVSRFTICILARQVRNHWNSVKIDARLCSERFTEFVYANTFATC